MVFDNRNPLQPKKVNDIPGTQAFSFHYGGTPPPPPIEVLVAQGKLDEVVPGLVSHPEKWIHHLGQIT